MSKKDRVSKTIDGLLAFCIALFTAMCALIGFVFVNYRTLNGIEISLAIFGLVALVIALCYFVFLYLKNLKKIGELK